MATREAHALATDGTCRLLSLQMDAWEPAALKTVVPPPVSSGRDQVTSVTGNEQEVLTWAGFCFGEPGPVGLLLRQLSHASCGWRLCQGSNGCGIFLPKLRDL